MKAILKEINFKVISSVGCSKPKPLLVQHVSQISYRLAHLPKQTSKAGADGKQLHEQIAICFIGVVKFGSL